MDERVDRLERRLADLTRALLHLEGRLARLEAEVARHGETAGSPFASALPESAAPRRIDGVAMLSLVGRTCVVLGGAYLLRALTDGGTLPRATGTLVGLAYGIGWLVMAWRSAGTSHTLSVALHAVAAALVVFPLLWEATWRFNLLTQASAALAMTAVTAFGLAIAWHRRTQPLAWVVTLAGLLASLAFMAAVPAGQSAAPVAFYLAFLGVVTLWFGYTLDWTWLRWPVALVADLTVLVMVVTASNVWHRAQAGAVMRVQMVLFAAYLVSFVARTLWRSRQVVPFEVLQMIALLVVAFGGAVYLMATTGSNPAGLGVVGLVLGLGSYAAAFAFLGWRGGHWRNLVFYASLGLVLLVAGTRLTVPASAQAIAWTVLAVLSALGGRRYSTVTLSSHATIYTIAAVVVSGLLGHAADALTAAVSRAWDPLWLPGLVVLAGAAVSAAVPLAWANESWGRWSRLPKIVLVVVLLWCAGGVVAGRAVPLLAGQPGSPLADAAIGASVRTVILAGSSLLLGWAGRGFFVEGRWLMYAVLLAGALKLIVEDFPSGRPSTLFLALAVYGGALALGPRLAARPRAASPAPSRASG